VHDEARYQLQSASVLKLSHRRTSSCSGRGGRSDRGSRAVGSAELDWPADPVGLVGWLADGRKYVLAGQVPTGSCPRLMRKQVVDIDAEHHGDPLDLVEV
jgi:hypothetical protein